MVNLGSFARFYIAGIAAIVVFYLPVPAPAALKESESNYREFRVQTPPDKAVVHVIEQQLDKFLELAASYNGYELRFSGTVGGTIRNATLPMNLEKLLKRLASHYDLAWRIDEKRLFVSAASLSEARTLDLEGLDLKRIRQAIEQGPIHANRFEVQVLNNGQSLRLVAPPSYLDAISAMAERLRR